MAKGKPGAVVQRSPSHARDMSYMKPKGYENHVTLTELSRIVSRDTSRLRKLEKDGRIPTAKRVPCGKLTVRLWSPKQVEEIKEIIPTLKPGRPRNAT